nr:thioredoxin [Pelagibacteraceae bacterium]
MDNKNIINVNEVDFESKVLEESSNKLVVVDFWAPWCGPCKQLTPILEKIISSSPDKIILAKINIDENQQIASQLRIQSIPAVFAFKDKQVVDAFQGVIPESEVIKFLEKCLGDKLENNFDEF